MLSALALLLQSDSGSHIAAFAGAGVGMVIWLAVMVVMIAAFWKVFTKAGEPGWAAIIPIYNAIVLLKIVGRPLWWIVLFLIPLVNIVVGFVVVFDLAKRFGHGAGFALGLIFLAPIFYPVLAWGDSRYSGTPALA